MQTCLEPYVTGGLEQLRKLSIVPIIKFRMFCFLGDLATLMINSNLLF
jgi:hypothetical protein